MHIHSNFNLLFGFNLLAALCPKLLLFQNGVHTQGRETPVDISAQLFFGVDLFRKAILAILWLAWPKNLTFSEKELNELSFAFFFKSLAQSRPKLLKFQKGTKLFWATLYRQWIFFFFKFEHKCSNFKLKFRIWLPFVEEKLHFKIVSEFMKTIDQKFKKK
jgi:hypothetical protein